MIERGKLLEKKKKNTVRSDITKEDFSGILKEFYKENLEPKFASRGLIDHGHATRSHLQ
jgi:hypothetical protein